MTTRAKTLQNRRREHRQRLALWETLNGLPPPFGQSAEKLVRDVAVWLQSESQTRQAATENGNVIIDWADMPPPCDPVCLLDNPHNTTRRKGVPVAQQVTMLQFSADTPVADNNSQEGTTAVKASRGTIKRWQVESFAAVLRVLLDRLMEQQGLQRQIHVVDFGCGTGALLLPLAHTFPQCHFTGVEMKQAALSILQQRVQAAGLMNVTCHLGMIEQYKGPLDIALALHACGNATDYVLLLAQQHQAAFIVSPCCVGKLKFSLEGGSSFHPTARTWQGLLEQNNGQESTSQQANGHATVSSTVQVNDENHSISDHTQTAEPFELKHPRSAALAAGLEPDAPRAFKLMASLADTNIETVQQNALKSDDCSIDDTELLEDSRLPTPQEHEIRRLCKIHVELDRAQAAREIGYACGLYQMLHAHSMAKTDLLVGVPPTLRLQAAHMIG